MKVLTIRQPWATLIMQKIENNELEITTSEILEKVLELLGKPKKGLK